MKTAPIKARDDGKAHALPRSATRSGVVFTPFPAGCDQKARAPRCKALPGLTPAAFCALLTAFLTHNASPENRVNKPSTFTVSTKLYETAMVIGFTDLKLQDVPDAGTVGVAA